MAVASCGRLESLASLLESVSPSLHGDDRLIVVDDTSDGSLLLGPGPPAMLMRSRGVGAGGARNLALAAVEREWIVFVDDDVLPPPGFLDGVRARVATGTFDVLTANVLSDSDSGAVGELFDARYPLSRGASLATYRGTTGTAWSPNDIWRVGVGACMVWRTSTLRAIGGFPPTLGQGRSNGGAEDMAAFRLALQHGATICYDGRLVVWHRSPRTRAELAAKMRAYARAEGAFAAYVWRSERRLGMMAHLMVDIVGTLRRVADELVQRRAGRVHLPITPVAAFPLDALCGFVGYLRAGPSAV